MLSLVTSNQYAYSSVASSELCRIFLLILFNQIFMTHAAHAVAMEKAAKGEN